MELELKRLTGGFSATIVERSILVSNDISETIEELYPGASVACMDPEDLNGTTAERLSEANLVVVHRTVGTAPLACLMTYGTRITAPIVAIDEPANASFGTRVHHLDAPFTYSGLRGLILCLIRGGELPAPRSIPSETHLERPAQ